VCSSAACLAARSASSSASRAFSTAIRAACGSLTFSLDREQLAEAYAIQVVLMQYVASDGDAQHLEAVIVNRGTPHPLLLALLDSSITRTRSAVRHGNHVLPLTAPRRECQDARHDD